MTFLRSHIPSYRSVMKQHATRPRHVDIGTTIYGPIRKYGMIVGLLHITRCRVVKVMEHFVPSTDQVFHNSPDFGAKFVREFLLPDLAEHYLHSITEWSQDRINLCNKDFVKIILCVVDSYNHICLGDYIAQCIYIMEN